MAEPRVHVIDYGIGNVGSIINMFRHVGITAERSADPDVLRQADRLVLPGVGAFDRARSRLRERGLDDVLNEQATRAGKPVLGICLGMQLLADASEEGSEPGLGWIAGTVRALKFEDPRIRVPHMGWAYVDVTRPHGILERMEAEPRFYFAHSYHFLPANEDDVLLTTEYGARRVVAAVHHENIVGMQFHPEKSHRFGMSVLAGFARWNP